MSSLSAKDRVSLCSFTFADGRRCLTPRVRNHPHFCFDHAQKEARALAAESLGKDLSYFFSGNYLSACDLSTAMARLIPAVLRGDVKPRVARTVAYMMQTLLQSIHISQHEYAEAFGGDGWRKAIRNSVNHNLDYRFPPAPKPKQPAPSAFRETLRNNPPASPSSPICHPPSSPVCHPERSEGSLPTPATPSAPSPAPSPQPAQTPPSSHSERSEGSLPTPATPSAPSPAPTPQPARPEQTRKVNPREPDRSAPWLSPGRPIPPDSKLL